MLLKPVLISIIGAVIIQCAPLPTAPHYSSEIIDIPSRPIILIGDLQRTSFFESLIGREQNDIARSKIISEASKENPRAVFLLGDLVFNGSSKNHWAKLDTLLQPLREFPILPIVGNHEYWGDNKAAMANLTSRFPFLKSKTWYSRTIGNIAFLIINSNQSDLSEPEWDEQINWYNERLEQFESDSSVLFTLVLSHHPPFTNSSVTDDEVHIQENFLEGFYSSKKANIFISAHAHGYERFNKQGKLFIVSAGGGGPRVRYLEGKKKRHDDSFKGPAPRPFHYLKLTQLDGQLTVTMRGLYDNEKIETLDQIIFTKIH